jgi:hypothetical protein
VPVYSFGEDIGLAKLMEDQKQDRMRGIGGATASAKAKAPLVPAAGALPPSVPLAKAATGKAKGKKKKAKAMKAKGSKAQAKAAKVAVPAGKAKGGTKKATKPRLALKVKKMRTGAEGAGPTESPAPPATIGDIN